MHSPFITSAPVSAGRGYTPATARRTAGVAISRSFVCTAATLGVALATAGLILSGRSGLLTFVFPAMALGLGAVLLWLEPARLLAWVLTLWMFAPLLRRVVDAQNGWNAQNPVLLAPMLVSGLCLFDILRFAPRLGRAAVLPLVLALIALASGVLVGLTVSPPALVLYAGLSWAAPILLGLHVAIHPEHHDQYHRAIVRTLGIGVVAVGLYGLAQFVAPSVWDRLWMINSQMNSIGTPVPFQVRVFSTLNAPGPLAQFLTAAVLILLALQASWKWPGVLLGMVVLLLSLARSAWLGFVVGFCLLLVLARPRIRRSAFAVLATGAVVLATLSVVPLRGAPDAMRRTISTRVSTMGDLSMDDSFRARQYLIPAVIADIEGRPMGSGLGATLVGGARGTASSRLADQGLYLDNGVLEILLVLGWFAGVLFLGSAVAAVAFAYPSVRASGAGYGYLAAAFALLVQVIGGTIFAGVGGAMFWLAVAMARTTDRSSAGRTMAPPVSARHATSPWGLA